MVRLLVLPVAALAVVLAACSSESPAPVAKSAAPAAAPKPVDESRRFPKTNLVDTKVVDTALLGKSFMPGGTLAHYKNGKTEYDMFVAKLPSATDAAILLPDWSQALTGSKLEPAFGGYFGLDGGRPVFVFTKGAWLAGIAGLPEKQADREARTLAGVLD